MHAITKKIIFLDIDGVLNNATDSIHYVEGYDGYLLHSPTCVDRLNLLTEVSGASIVVSSTWRIGETMESMQEMLTAIGVKGNFIGITPSLDGGNLRGNEILYWIKQNIDLLSLGPDISYHDFKSYVILDDDTDMLYWQKDNFVKTNGMLGLQGYECRRALQILDTVHPTYKFLNRTRFDDPIRVPTRQDEEILGNSK